MKTDPQQMSQMRERWEKLISDVPHDNCNCFCDVSDVMGILNGDEHFSNCSLADSNNVVTYGICRQKKDVEFKQCASIHGKQCNCTRNKRIANGIVEMIVAGETLVVKLQDAIEAFKREAHKI